MTQTFETPEVDANLKLARNIVADTYLKIETGRGKKPDSFATFAAWGNHLDDYSRFLREGAYDDDIAVQSALAALIMKDALNRRLPPLAYRNSIDRLFNTVEAPTDNIAWMDSISHRLAIVTAEMNAEREREQRMEMEQFTDNYGLGMGA